MSTTFKKEKKRKELEGKQNYCCPMNLGEM
jgi:hypothetical protein